MTDLHGYMFATILFLQILLWWHVTEMLHLLTLDSRKNLELFRSLMNNQRELMSSLTLGSGACPTTRTDQKRYVP